MKESKICVCGAGTMGRGIALTIAAKGIDVILYDLNEGMLSSAKTSIENELHHELGKKRISAEEKIHTIARIAYTTLISNCCAPLIIEAIIEKPKAKSELFLELAKYNTEHTIFASNTSSLSILGIAEQSPFPERIVGLHFFNPATRMKLVEVIRTKYISDGLVNRMVSFVKQFGKTPVICKDAPGFIVNHVARPFYLEALRLAESGIADMETIDKLMESAGFKMGPFHLMDLIGNDINYTVSCSLYEALAKPERLRPSTLQEENVKQGRLGRKTGSGFFQYSSK